MTVKLSDQSSIVRALRILADDLEAGRVETFSIEAGTLVARMAVVYYRGGASESELPGLPGAVVEIEPDEDTDTARIDTSWRTR